MDILTEVLTRVNDEILVEANAFNNYYNSIDFESVEDKDSLFEEIMFKIKILDIRVDEAFTLAKMGYAIGGISLETIEHYDNLEKSMAKYVRRLIDEIEERLLWV